jgi:hypothetical protein
MNTRTWKFLIVFTVIMMLLIACVPPSSDSRTAEQVNAQQEVYNQNQPIPSFDYSLERDEAIQLYRIRNEARNTWTVVTSQGTGSPVWMCPSIGYPLPYDVQLTNPLRGDRYCLEGGTCAEGAIVVEQAEPNGLYSSKNTSGTWVMCVNDSGKVTPVYTELNATAFPYSVKIVDGTIVPADNSAPSVVLDIKTKP